MNTKKLTKIALMTAIICVLAPLSIPLPFTPIYITMATFTLYLTAYILNTEEAVISVLMYLLIGAVGVPVFSNYSAGIQKFASPSGGYLLGYIVLVLISSYFVTKFKEKPIIQIIGCFLASKVLYIIGSIWLAQATNAPVLSTIKIAMITYTPLDTVKLLAAHFLGRKVKLHLDSANI